MARSPRSLRSTYLSSLTCERWEGGVEACKWQRSVAAQSKRKGAPESSSPAAELICAPTACVSRARAVSVRRRITDDMKLSEIGPIPNPSDL
jgi:hypothetical protein